MVLDKVKDFYNKLTARERVLFYGTLGTILFVLTDFIVLSPIFSNISVLEAEIKAKSQSIQRDMRILSFKDGIYHEYRKYESYLDTGEKTQEEIISTLLRKLESVAGQNSIAISNVSPGEIEEKPIYKVYKTTLDFEGDLHSVFVFMNALEESDNLFQITRYVLAPKSKAGTNMKCNMDITRILMTSEDMAPFAEEGLDAQSSAPQEPQAPADAAPPEPDGAAGNPQAEPI